jgi:hypothetical protein
LVGSHFYVNPDSDTEKSILIAGTARSGTTWLADLICSQIPCRILFEPFNPNLVPEYSKFNYFQYIRQGEQDADLYSFTSKIFRGEFRNRWVDHQNERIFPKYRLIKEIRANLLLKWLHDNFPKVPILFLIRHPCAVVLSRMELGWATDRDIEPFLAQPELVSDYLVDYMDLIRSSNSDEEKHAIIWSISNLIPLKQFIPGELKIIYYEHLCIQPEIELPNIFDSINQPFNQTVLEKINQPSSTTKRRSVRTNGLQKISHWKSALTTSQIERVLKVVDAFGLGNLYNDALTPKNSLISVSKQNDFD